MSKPIERVRYYEGEYLRSPDFVAEQAYHTQMRRRLNLALHLWGIVDGLDVIKTTLPDGTDQYSVGAGMAIDAYGREIILAAPHPLTEDDLNNNQANKDGTYSLWIAYDREAATPPTPGYGLCHSSGKLNQYTRWRETARIVIKEYSYQNSATVPAVFADLSDDPTKETWLIRLGKIVVGHNSATTAITITANPELREYIGVRAQHIVAPVASLPTTAPDSTRPISVDFDLRAKNNVLVGDPTKIVVPPPAAVNPLEGNLTVVGDLFLNGGVNVNVAGQWFGLKAYIQTLIPDVVLAEKQFTVAAVATQTTDLSTGSELLTVASSKLPAVTDAKIFAAISKIEWSSKNDLTNVSNNASGTSQPSISLKASKVSTTGNGGQFKIDWEIAPTYRPTGSSPVLPIASLTISCMVIFYP